MTKDFYLEYIKNSYKSIKKVYSPKENWTKDLSRSFMKKDVQRLINMKRCSTSLIIREMQTKTTIHKTRMTKIKMVGSTSFVKDVEQLEL